MPCLCLIQLVYKTGVYLDFLNLFLFGIQSLIFESERFVYSSSCSVSCFYWWYHGCYSVGVLIISCYLVKENIFSVTSQDFQILSRVLLSLLMLVTTFISLNARVYFLLSLSLESCCEVFHYLEP